MQYKSRRATLILSCFVLFYLVYFFGRSLQFAIFSPRPNDFQLEYHILQNGPLDQLLQDYLRSNSTSITPIIHQSWKTHILPTNRSKRWSASWKSCFPNWEWKLWSDEENLGLIRDHYPWFLPIYLSFTNAVERADISRYFYMFHYGGIYTDLDNVCIRNFAHLLANFSLIFGGMDGVSDGDAILHTYVQNPFMASRPRHPFWMRVISRVMLYRHTGRNGRAEMTTGPYVLMDEMKDYLTHTNRDLKIYKSKYFNPFSWYANKIEVCKDLGRMTSDDEKKCLAAHSKSYVVQFHTQSWLNGHL